MRLFLATLAVLILPASLVACSQDKTEEPAKHVTKQESNISDVPKTFEEIMRQNPSKYAGNNYDQVAVEKELDRIPKEYTNDPAKVYAYINSLVAENYQSRYQRLLAFDPDFSVSNQTPNGKIEIPKLEQINVEIILDASGSMAGNVSGGQKMDLAKEAVRNFVSSVPKEAKVSLRVYGHKGSNQGKDKQISCQSSELVYPLSTYNEVQFESALSKFNPTGWTPLARGIEEAQKDMERAQGEGVRNIIYVVSDGIETCGGDPVTAAKKLKNSGIKPVINIVGFDVDDAGQRQLKQVASAAGGVYKSVYSEADLREYMQAEKDRIKNEWENWAISVKSDAFDSWAKKRKELENVVEELHSLKDLEIKHMYSARDYLKNKKVISNEVASDISLLVYDRERTIRKALLDEYFELGDKLEQVEKQIKDQADETSSKNISGLE